MSEWRLIHGDCIEVMAGLPANSIDSIVTDPPCLLGFMNKAWDVLDERFHLGWAEAALRIAKPGAFLLAFGGTRTWHRLACALEDAGFEIRDTLMWLYGSGFPKSLDISKAIDRHAGTATPNAGVPVSGNSAMAGPNYERSAKGNAETALGRHWEGWGTALKPAWEPIIVAMKPVDGSFARNAERWGVAGMHVDGGRVTVTGANPSIMRRQGSTRHCLPGTYREDEGRMGNRTRPEVFASPRPGEEFGRWPANLVLDEVAAAQLEAQSGYVGGRDHRGFVGGQRPGGFANVGADIGDNKPCGILRDDAGGASRFFYVAKADRAERDAGLETLPRQFAATMGGGIGEREHDPAESRAYVRNIHPTVKPLTLMHYLLRLTATPSGGVVLDPFAGSGTTLVAAIQIGRPSIGIEREAEYVEIARARCTHADRQGILALEMPNREGDEIRDRQLALFDAPADSGSALTARAETEHPSGAKEEGPPDPEVQAGHESP